MVSIVGSSDGKEEFMKKSVHVTEKILQVEVFESSFLEFKAEYIKWNDYMNKNCRSKVAPLSPDDLLISIALSNAAEMFKDINKANNLLD